MVIDFHTHIFPDKIAKKTIDSLAQHSSSIPYTDGTAEGLIKNMENAGVDIAVSLPVLTKPTQFDSVLNYAVSINETYKNKDRKIISFAGMHPACENIGNKMRLIKESGILGVKIHPDYQSTFIDDDGYIEILKSAKDYDLIVVTHSGVDDAYVGESVKCPPERCRKVIEKIGHKKFVLGHYGAHKQWQETLEILSDCDVFFDTAYTMHEIDKKLFLDIANKHGYDKILFATDCPWRDMKMDLSKIKDVIPDKDKLDMVLYKNALKLLGIGGKYDLQ